MFARIFLLVVLILSFNQSLPLFSENARIRNSPCTYDGFPLQGRVQFVDAFPDLKVKLVNAFPDDCGEWQIVSAFPDLKIQIVNAFPDIKIQYVEAFPGIAD